MTYTTSLPVLLDVYKYFQANPDARINTGIWTQPTWTRAEFKRWFMRCLHAKINREDSRAYRALTDEYQMDLIRDARTINAYTGQRIRHTGCNGLLRTSEMQAKYPHINRQERD